MLIVNDANGSGDSAVVMPLRGSMVARSLVDSGCGAPFQLINTNNIFRFKICSLIHYHFLFF